MANTGSAISVPEDEKGHPSAVSQKFLRMRCRELVPKCNRIYASSSQMRKIFSKLQNMRPDLCFTAFATYPRRGIPTLVRADKLVADDAPCILLSAVRDNTCDFSLSRQDPTQSLFLAVSRITAFDCADLLSRSFV